MSALDGIVAPVVRVLLTAFTIPAEEGNRRLNMVDGLFAVAAALEALRRDDVDA